MRRRVSKLCIAVVLVAVAAMLHPALVVNTGAEGVKDIPPDKTVLAIYSVEPMGVEASLAKALTPHLILVINKYRSKVQIVQNEAVEKALDNVGLAASGACTDTECLPALGKILGANRFLITSLSKLNTYTVYASVYDAESGALMFSDFEKGAVSEDDIPDALDRLANRVMAKLNGKKATKPPTPEPLVKTDDKEKVENIDEKPKTGWLGTKNSKALTLGRIKELNLTISGGIEITEVVPESPAAKAGIKVGDIIVEIDGNSVDNYQQYNTLMDSHKPGETVVLKLVRNGSILSLEVKLGDPSEKPFSKRYLSKVCEVKVDSYLQSYRDTFDNIKKWKWYDFGDWSWKDGKFIGRTTDRLSTSLSPFGKFTDLTLSARVKKISGNDNAPHGIALRTNFAGGNGYYFFVDNSGYYKFTAMKKRKWVNIIGWQRSQYLKPNEENILQVTAKDDCFNFYVNGIFIDSARDANSSKGRVGVYMNPQLGVEFDDFTVQEIK